VHSYGIFSVLHLNLNIEPLIKFSPSREAVPSKSEQAMEIPLKMCLFLSLTAK
jgi:hypothetical protein